MKLTTKLGFAGGAYGMLAGTLIAALVMTVFPDIPHPIRPTHVFLDLGWAFFFSSPWGFGVGATLAGYLYERTSDVSSFQWLAVESAIATGTVATLVTQLGLPSALNLSRGPFAIVVALATVILSLIGAWLLKPLYWRK